MSRKNLLICFDAFGTLFTPRKPVPQQYSEVARTFGLSGFSDDDIAKSFKEGEWLLFVLWSPISGLTKTLPPAAFKKESKQNPNYGKATGLGAEKWWGNVSH
jgi:hypothetical protein